MVGQSTRGLPLKLWRAIRAPLHLPASGDDGDEPNPLQVFPERPDVIETFRYMRPFERDRLVEEAPVERVNPADLKTNQKTVTKKTIQWFMDHPEEIRKPRSNIGLSDTE